jgi:acyl-CoA thioester hydrolase
MTPDAAGGGRPFTWTVRAYYEDTDASGVVYHAAYVRYFERARTEWLRARGFSQEALRAQDVAFTVANLEVDFLRPARLDDELEVTVVIEKIGRASLEISQVLGRPGGPPLARARVRVGCVAVSTFRPCPLPAALGRQLAP